MLRLVLDPYEVYSPYNLDHWQRFRKTRWSGDDDFSESKAQNNASSNARKRKPVTSLVTIESSLMTTENGAAAKKKKRWGSQARTKLTIDDMNQFQARIAALTKINQRLLFPKCTPEQGDPFFDLPEPPPEYDSTGKRTNTLEVRYREKLERDKNMLIYHLLQLNPTYTAPANYKAPQFECILWFPTKQYPSSNFIGAVLGPRGNTQKRLEKESGCKIAVRGKGAEKNIVRRIKNPRTGDLEELPHHVYLSAPTEEKLEKGMELVKPLLKPQTELARMEQMKELALINGTYRFDMRCKECGEMGHREIQCPLKKNTYFANVQCDKCGDISHVTRDCPNKGIFESSQKELDIEYKQFIAEINGEDPTEAKKRAEMESLMDSERRSHMEIFQSDMHQTGVTVMKPSPATNLIPLTPSDQKIINAASAINSATSITKNRSFLTN